MDEDNGGYNQCQEEGSNQRGKLDCEVMEKIWRDGGTNLTGRYQID